MLFHVSNSIPFHLLGCVIFYSDKYITVHHERGIAYFHSTSPTLQVVCPD